MTPIAFILTLVIAVLACGAAPASQGVGDRAAGQSCDRLAAFNDGRAPMPAVRLHNLDANAAISACSAALDTAEARPRHHLQLARALIKADRASDARRHLEAAIAWEGAYPAASFVLAQLFHTGRGVDANTERAYTLYSRAYEGGYADAAIGLLMLYEDPASGYFDPDAARSARLLLGLSVN